MKKKLLLTAGVLVMATSLFACKKEATKEEASDIVYFENGVVYTSTEEDTIAEALAMEDGKIVFVGSAKDGESYKEKAKEVVDLDGGMLMPGFIDGHIHTVTPNFFDFNLLSDTEVDAALNTIETYVNENPDKELYSAYGYLTSMFEGEELEKGPSKERLDKICPDKPLAVFAFDGHAAWLNSKAFELSKITPETKVTPGGEIPLTASGELWGSLKDSALSMIAPELLELSDDKAEDVLTEYQTLMNSYGYTSIMAFPGNGFMPIPWKGFASLMDEDQLTLRVHGAGIVKSWSIDEDLETVKKLHEEYDSDLLACTSAKIFADGVMDSKSAYMLAPYEGEPDNYGETAWSQDDLNKVFVSLNEANIQAHVHAIGDGATRLALNAAEYAKENTAEGDYRNAITHLQIVADEDKPRFGELDVLAVTQPYWALKQPDYWKEIEHASLGDRADTEYPLKSLQDAGATIVAASDYPVTIDPNPFIAVETGVTRNLADATPYGVEEITDMDDPQWLLAPEERLSVEDMIRAYTVNAAFSIFSDDVTGTLEVGKSADLIVVDQNILEVNPVDISNTKVLQTYLQGKKVFDRNTKVD